MSAGGNLRRGYAYGISAGVHSGSTHGRRSGSPDLPSLILVGTIILVIAAIAFDPFLAASIGRILGTAWSDSVELLRGMASRAL